MHTVYVTTSPSLFSESEFWPNIDTVCGVGAMAPPGRPVPPPNIDTVCGVGAMAPPGRPVPHLS